MHDSSSDYNGEKGGQQRALIGSHLERLQGRREGEGRSLSRKENSEIPFAMSPRMR